MASPTQWTWVRVSSWSWWWIGKPDVLPSMGLQRVRHHWATELNWLRLLEASRQIRVFFSSVFILTSCLYCRLCAHWCPPLFLEKHHALMLPHASSVNILTPDSPSPKLEPSANRRPLSGYRYLIFWGTFQYLKVWYLNSLTTETTKNMFSKYKSKMYIWSSFGKVPKNKRKKSLIVLPTDEPWLFFPVVFKG